MLHVLQQSELEGLALMSTCYSNLVCLSVNAYQCHPAPRSVRSGSL